jgi:hypothetical protein
MDDELVTIAGENIPPDNLNIRRAKEFVDYLVSKNCLYATFRECYKSNDSPHKETIVLDVGVERSQIGKHDIRSTERIAVVFFENDSLPEVLALRKSFPHVPHTNLRLTEIPRSLCLYDESWDEIKRRWTPVRFVESIRTWLSETNKGTLHKEDQPLEPILMTYGDYLILPNDLFSGDSQSPQPLAIESVTENHKVLRAYRPEDIGEQKKTPAFVALAMMCPPQEHGVIRHSPQNLKDLNDLVDSPTFDLLGQLRKQLKEWDKQKYLDAFLILILGFPKTRDEKTLVEATDLYAFLSINKTIRDIGVDIGLWELHEGKTGILILPDETKQGENVPLHILNPQYAFSSQQASRLNGYEPFCPKKITVIGVGALGSQVVMNMARSGYAQWAIIDEDYLLPHNLARHELNNDYVGWPKAHALANHLNILYFPRKETAIGIVANLLRPQESAEQVKNALSSADVIFDISTSVAVGRYLARDVDSPARRISLFLNPKGTDLVFLSEGKDRLIPLDALEIQYYRALITHDELINHLALPEGKVRYARSCRDISSTIPHDFVSLHASIASRSLHNSFSEDSAKIIIWQAENNMENVRQIRISPSKIHSIKIGEWTLVIDEFLIGKVKAFRNEKLPNETGGIFVGSYDLSKNILYVADTIFSPPDSEEWPCAYIRGSKNLKEEIERIHEITAGNLEYVGEWHSHPDGCSCDPSNDDKLFLDWLAGYMRNDGLPALMLIAGQAGNFKLHLSTD